MTRAGVRLAALAATGLLCGGCFTDQFGIVRDGVLYRGSRPSLEELEGVCRAYDIRTIVRVGGNLSPDDEEARYAAANRIKLLDLAIPTGEPPTPAQLQKFFNVIENPRTRPVLVHCRAGLERTGALVAAYRIKYEAWTPAEAIAEMEDYGYVEWIWPAQQEFVETLPELLRAMQRWPPTDGP